MRRVCARTRRLATIIFVRRAVLVVFAACAHPSPPAPDGPNDTPADALRHYTIWLGGARVGSAEERETWSHTGVTLRREERLVFLRGDAAVAMTTTIEIAADPALSPRRVAWTERGTTTRHGDAVRDARGWAVTLWGAGGMSDARTTVRPMDATQLVLPADAIPSELLPLVVRRDGRFAGPVFLPARGFVAGRGRVEAVAPDRLVARLALDAGVTAEATIDLDRDGAPARVVDGDGVIAVRATAAETQAAFAPVDLVAATSVPLTGRRGDGAHVVLVGDIAVPPLPGQAARPASAGLELALSPQLPGGLPPGLPGPDRTRELAALVTAVQSRIAPDLGASVASARDAAAATAGDCTTFALAYAALAERRAIPTRVVTGLRVDGDRLVRHRWAVSWTGRAWVAVDAAFGAVPAGGDLIGLAVHGADDAGLIAGEAALTQVRAASWQ